MYDVYSCFLLTFSFKSLSRSFGHPISENACEVMFAKSSKLSSYDPIIILWLVEAVVTDSLSIRSPGVCEQLETSQC